MKVEKVKKLRILIKKSQQEFAELLGVSVSSVANWESGRREPSKLAMQSVYELMQVKGILEQNI